MKVLWMAPTCMNMEPVVSTLPGELYFYMDNPESDPHRDTLPKIEAVKPDLVIYISVAAGPYFLKAETIKQIKVPIINFNCDAACPGWAPGNAYYRENDCFDLTVNIDGNDNWLKGPKDLTLWCPLDPSFYKPDPEKTINLGWAGGTGSPDRQKIISELGDWVTVMSRNEKWGSYQEYADFLSSCRFTFNMAKSGSGLAMQTKNRVREAGYASCVLLEEKGSPTRNWFTPREDYLEFESARQLRDLMSTIYPSEQRAMAKSLREKCLTLYSPAKFWEKVLGNI